MMYQQIPEIIAHRGASSEAPENTLASVRLAYAQGANAVEIDVQLSADLQLMVIHDEDTGRTAGEPPLLVKQTPAAALKQLEVGSWKAAAYRGERIPLLEEVLQEVPPGKKLVIELKPGPEILPILQQVVEVSGLQDRLVFISFNKDSVLQARKRLPAIPAFWLLHNWSEYSLNKAIGIAKAGGLQGLDLHYKLVNKDLMEQMQASQLQVLVYTVNDPDIAKKLAALGVAGITTDRPQWLRTQLETREL